MFNLYFYYRKILYSFFIVFIHDYPILQLISISTLNYALIILAVKIKPFEEKSQQKIQVLTEFLLSLTCLSIVIFQAIDNYYFIAGWIIISSTSLVILIHFFLILKGLIQTFKMIFLKQEVTYMSEKKRLSRLKTNGKKIFILY